LGFSNTSSEESEEVIIIFLEESNGINKGSGNIVILVEYISTSLELVKISTSDINRFFGMPE
jgi:hypothetical protein